MSTSLDSVKRFFLLGFSRVYVFLSTILCLDTWLLYTRSDNAVENRKRKRFLLLLLILLPLLLFGGECNSIYSFPFPLSTSISSHPSTKNWNSNRSFHSLFLQELTFTLTLPRISPCLSFPFPS